jgi:glycogen debranching enzyme
MMRTCYRFILVLLLGISAFASEGPPSLKLSRPVRTWEFMGSFGQRAGVFGKEDGSFEAWIYPMKLLRDFHLTFHVEGQTIPAASIARTIIVHPESTTIVYSYDQFEVRETICVPVHEMGAIIRLETNAYAPVQIEAAYTNDLQLMWPAGLGNVWPGFDEKLNAFTISGEQYFGIVGAKGLVLGGEAYVTNYGSSQTSAFYLPEVPKGTTTQVIAIAGSIKGHDDAAAEYQKLLANADQLVQQSAQYYRDYLARTLSVEFPDDRKLQEAYDWARVSVIQGLVDNPYLGTGLVAGYRRSGFMARPGFAWFFGRDSEWASLALNSIGDFTSTKTALEFLLRVQLKNGRIPHEVSQTATLTDWFNKYPFATASADATPLFIIAVDDYVTQSGDNEFARQNWEHIAKAYDFLKSTYDAEGFAKNEGVGTGWVEGGPLVPIHSELYQASLAVQAERSLGHLAGLLGKNDLAAQMSSTATDRLNKIEQKFWIPSKNAYAFGIGMNSRMNDTVSVEATVPMWFGLLNAEHANAMIDQLASSHHSTDWGMRIMSDEAAGYSPDGYHNGAVWPLFTGWAAVGEYRYHRPLAAYQNMRENAMLTLDGALGHDTEVLSGAYFQQFSTASPHQIWSAAMVISPVLRGMMGLKSEAPEKTLVFAPHVPAGWNTFTLTNVAFGSGTVDLAYSRQADVITLKVIPHGGGILQFSPALSPRADVVGVEIDGAKAQFKMEKSATDQHVIVNVPLNGTPVVTIRLADDFQLGVPARLPELGDTSQNIKPISQTWTGKEVEYVFEGLSGHTYSLPVRGLETVSSVEGARYIRDAEPTDQTGALVVSFPPGTGYVRQKVVVRFE